MTTCIKHLHAEFGIALSCAAKEDVCLCQFFKANLPPEDGIICKKQSHNGDPHLSSAVFSIAIWEMVKPEYPKEGC